MTYQVWYHGTRPEHVPEIRDRGLQTPAGVMHPAKWFQLTDSREQAEHYAQPGGRVLEYHIPHELTSHRTNDDALLWPKHPHDYGDVSAHAVAPRRPIGAEYIADEHPVPDHDGSRLGFRQAAEDRFRCPRGLPVEFDVQDGWQHADGSISHDGCFADRSVSDLMDLREKRHEQHQAGKGKPRRDAPDVARRADQAAQGPSGRVAPDSSRDDDGGKPPSALRALNEHPKVARDLAKLPKNVQAAYHERVDGLRRGEPHPSTHALTGPLKGWQGTSLNFLNRVVHRYDGDELHVLSAGNHDEAYDQGARRLGSHVPASPLYDSPSRWRFKQHEWDTRDRHNIEHTKPFGEYTLHAEPKYDDGDRQLHVTTADGQHVGEAYTGDHPNRPGHIELAPEVHPDHRRKGIGTALYNYAEELAGKSAAPAESHTDAAEAFWQHRKQGRYTAPKERLFGPTFGLDTRLWDGEKLRPEVREDIIARFDAFCQRHGYEGWHRWAKIVFFGSEASEWTSKSLVGNGDFDLSIGIHYPALKATVPGFAEMTDEIIAAGLTQEMHVELNADDEWFAVNFTTWHQNPNLTSHGPSSNTDPGVAPPTSPLRSRSASRPSVERWLLAEWSVGMTVPRSDRSEPPADTAEPISAGKLIPNSSRRTARSAPSASASTSGTITSGRGMDSLPSSTTPSWSLREAAARSADAATFSSPWIMTTPAARENAAAASAYEASSVPGAIRQSATSASTTLGPHSVISVGGPPSIPLPEGGRWIGPFSHTWYANLQGWDIALIRPYAAYDVVADEWIVKPPHLEDWSLKDFPEGPGMAEAVRGIVELAEGYLAMPEPHRTQNGAALWEFVHSNRSDAFGPNGEGWWDVRNVIEKALDQKGLMQQLWQCHDRAEKDPESLASPSDWSNTPVAAR